MIGIDLGTTNSLVFIWDEEARDAVSLSGLVPSVVDVTAKVIGRTAKENISRPETQSDHIYSSFKIDIAQDYSIAASRAVLKELGEYTTERDCVITVPAYFSSLQRRNTKQAAEMAGFAVHALLNEPTAAAIYYNRTNKRASLVYDLGGGTFDISLIDSRNGGYEVMSTEGLAVGGDDLDRMLASYIMNRCQYRQAMMNYDEASRIFKAIAEEAKLAIQKTRQDYFVDLSNTPVCKAVEFTSLTIDVATYKQCVYAAFRHTFKLAKKVIKESYVRPETITLVLVGGSTRDPFLRDMIEQELGIIPVPLTYNPDEIVAQGAAFYAHMIEEGTAEEEVSDVCNAIKLLSSNDTLSTVIPKNSFLPIEMVYVANNSSESKGIELLVYEGDSDVPTPEGYLGALRYDFKDGVKPANSVLVTCRFKLDGSGILRVSACELGGEEKAIDLSV